MVTRTDLPMTMHSIMDEGFRHGRICFMWLGGSIASRREFVAKTAVVVVALFGALYVIRWLCCVAGGMNGTVDR
jgi:hypothetical protein